MARVYPAPDGGAPVSAGRHAPAIRATGGRVYRLAASRQDCPATRRRRAPRRRFHHVDMDPEAMTGLEQYVAELERELADLQPQRLAIAGPPPVADPASVGEGA